MGTVQKTCDFTQQYSDDPPNASLLSLGSLQTLTIHHVNFCGIQGNGSIFNGIQRILSNFIVLRASRERNATISSNNIQHLYYFLFLTYKPCLCNLEIPQFQLKPNLKYMSISHPKLCEPRHTSPGHLVSSSPKLYLYFDKVSPVVNRTSVKSKKSAPRSKQKRRTAAKELPSDGDIWIGGNYVYIQSHQVRSGFTTRFASFSESFCAVADGTATSNIILN